MMTLELLSEMESLEEKFRKEIKKQLKNKGRIIILGNAHILTIDEDNIITVEDVEKIELLQDESIVLTASVYGAPFTADLLEYNLNELTQILNMI